MIKSLLNTTETIHSLADLQAWIERRNCEVEVQVDEVPFAQMRGWQVSEDGSLRHESGKFFTIQGVHVAEENHGRVKEWDQPIINQPEVGYLGILTKEINGCLYFLMQAKIEPGNVNCVQISPTLQATKSNYTQQHKGKKPAYLDYFMDAKPSQILLDQLQSEQGARFLRKRNRNIIIKVDEEVPVLDDFAWMTLGQIKEMMHHDNLVNMDTRTVLAGIDFAQYLTPNHQSSIINQQSSINNHQSLILMSAFGQDMLLSAQSHDGYHTMNEHLSWLTNLKAMADLTISYKPVKELQGWEERDMEIARPDGKFFRVMGVNVTIANREVASWCQPLVQPMQQGICAFIIKKIGDVYHFLVHAKLECGNFDVYELAPTVQCLTGNVLEVSPENRPAFADYVMNAKPEQIHYDTLQSEEGGRFYHEQNRNMIVEVGDEFPIELPEEYHWMTLGQIFEFLRFNNYINIQARSLIAAIKYV